MPELDKKFKHTIEVVVDRLVMRADLRLRLTQSIETAAGLADGLVAVDLVGMLREGGRAAPLLRELRLPRPRRLAAGAAAADLLLQRAARRLPALHRPRLAAGDRPGPARARSVALDRRRRARAVVGRRLVGLLRGRDPGDRRPLRDRHVEAVVRADRGGAGPLPQRHGRREDLRPVPQPHGAAAPVHARVRRHRREPSAPLQGDGLVHAARADRGVHVAAPVPGLQGRAPQAGGARGHRRRPLDRRVHADVGDARARVPRRARADADRGADRAPDREGDPRAARPSSTTSASATSRSTARRRRCRAARRSASGSRRRSARSSSASSTSSTSRRSACTSATTRG